MAPHWSRHVSDGRRFRRRGFDAWGIEKTEMGSYLEWGKKGRVSCRILTLPRRKTAAGILPRRDFCERLLIARAPRFSAEGHPVGYTDAFVDRHRETGTGLGFGLDDSGIPLLTSDALENRHHSRHCADVFSQSCVDEPSYNRLPLGSSCQPPTRP